MVFVDINIPFKSYCWAIGTTSYRPENFNLNIEKQLQLMDEFKRLPKSTEKTWQELQVSYYDFLKSKKFVKGDAARKDKDAREKTSGLVDIGLLDDERNLTQAGNALLELSLENDFKSDNKLEISKDSYIYLMQLLKTSNNVNGKIVRPFIVFIYLEARLDYLTFDEFTYLLPLCTDREMTDKIVDNILKYRINKITFDEILISVFMSMDNYKKAYNVLRENIVTEKVIGIIGMNRKSRTYDKPYYNLYRLLKKVVIKKDEKSVIPLYLAVKKLNGKAKTMWMKYLFATTVYRVVKKRKLEILRDNNIFSAKDKETFNKAFFERLHLYKMKATLIDYMDLNRRYFKTTDTVLFTDRKVVFDILPKYYFINIAEELISIAFEENYDLRNNIQIEQIAPCFAINEKILYASLSKAVGTTIESAEQAKKIVKDERYERFKKIINERFTKTQLIDLFTRFENREDEYIRRYITDNADIPTMFEYVLGIAWYLISDMQGEILEYMNLSLDADLLPKTHAGGGEADVIYKYIQTANYPEHTLLIEATLSEKVGQRKMEMEPVSRHLGDYLIKNKDKKAYCVFIATFLHRNIIQDFRIRKNAKYFDNDGSKFIDGMKIIPLQTSEIKTILEKDILYSNLYQILDTANSSSTDVTEWYEKEIVNSLLNKE